MNIKTALKYISQQLLECGIENPTLEARILISHVLIKSKEYLIINSEQDIDEDKIHYLEELVARRKNLEPIAYITGIKEFYGRDFIVNKNVLIPRPDSETLIEAVLSKKPKEVTIFELGVGSGCLILTLMLELQNSNGLGVDINARALKVAAANCEKHALQDRVKFIESDWFSNLGERKFDIIISNPPYISGAEKMAKETLLHEPSLALFAGCNGLAAYIEIARRAKDFLKAKGLLYLEIGYDQASSVADLFLNEGYRIIGKHKDLAGYVRCLEFEVN